MVALYVCTPPACMVWGEVRFLGNEVTNGCEMPSRVLGTGPWSSAGAVELLTSEPSSPILVMFETGVHCETQVDTKSLSFQRLV